MKAINKLHDELRSRSEDLRAAEETVKQSTSERLLLEQKLFRLEKKKNEEVLLKFELCIPMVYS